MAIIECLSPEHLQESWKPGPTINGWGGGHEWEGGLAQSEINNSTLIHHEPVITATPPVAKAFLSEQLQRAGGGLLLSMFMKC